jgi:hypothetical protein
VSVQWTTAEGTAISSGNPGNRDFAAASGTLTWAAGDGASKTINVSVNGDTTVEPNETFTVVLTNPVAATLSGTGIGTGTITNDD